MTKIHDAANWNAPEDSFTQIFYDQNVRQFWLSEEIPIPNDRLVWASLSVPEKDAYKKALAGLTLLDTEQGDVGMPKIMMHVEGHMRKAVLNFMAMMENAVHAKSYSSIFTTLLPSEEINALFEWVKNNKYLQFKARKIVEHYNNIEKDDPISLYKALVSSVQLESYLFYSGFFYPLYLSGQGKMTNSGEIIELIIRDESIHGVYTGLLAQEIYNVQSEEVKTYLKEFTYNLMLELYENECEYSAELYDQVELTHEVKKFVRYNANKALQNLGFEAYFEAEEINPIVLNGINTHSKDHDFFSKKGNGYQMAIVEPTKDEDFIFED